MRVLIVSDTHGSERNLEKVLERVGPLDLLIHCGDVENHEDYIGASVEFPAYFVRGNNDFYTDLLDEEIIEVCQKRIFVTHGHRYGVSYGHERLLEEGKRLGADIICYGHTHVPVIEIGDVTTPTIVNPGSLTYPRQEGRHPSYIILEFDRKNEAHFHLGLL